jgi:hypothetical protein
MPCSEDDLSEHGRSAVDEQTIDLIAQRVISALRDDLEAIAAELSAPANANNQLTVDQVAQRLGVARSTVYARWRDWGGYKLGASAKAPIRFDSDALPIVRPPLAPAQAVGVAPAPGRPSRRRQRRPDLLVDAPRLRQQLDGIA